MKYSELDSRLRKVYSRIRTLDDYHWDLSGDKIIGRHKKSDLKIRIRVANSREEAEKLSEVKEGEGLDIVVVPNKGTFYIHNGTFIMTSKFLRGTLVDINDHIVWRGFKVVEQDGKLMQEDFYEYLGGRFIEHLKNNMTIGQDFVFWQFYKCEKCGKYVDIDSVRSHLKEHGIKIEDKDEMMYEVFEISIIDGKVYDKFGKEVKEDKLSEEAKDFIKETLESFKS
ncbi:hypothetical protein [Thermococcus barophilus]|uniref:Uncharacterized protein n=2 Tax=Thermococcus barophilus TaxID=55802 RepID=A0A0S1XA74_THEBA|nr:hypothetical protein [Thermococcus barophilus]ADT83469.1 hypothetical protein TERMP_00492 [Thermococcus barophilus MP]ALM74673.1 hypothetical protein TBCH5v1_0715 [Thermococcus barophilus]